MKMMDALEAVVKLTEFEECEDQVPRYKHYNHQIANRKYQVARCKCEVAR